MYHPTTRVLTVLELLQAYPGLNSSQLAARLEVDRRTIRRYIMMLEDMGIPVDAERGPYGGYRLRPGFKLPPLMVSGDEALAIVLSLIAARNAGIPVEPHAVAGALAKIERVLPDTLRERIEAVQAVVSFGPTARAPQPPAELVLTLSQAAQQQRRVRLSYLSRSAETVRDVDPYGVVQHRNHWYTIGWCHLRRAMRVFRLDQIVDCEQLPQTFVKPDGFEPLPELLASLAGTPAAWEAEIVLHTTLDQAEHAFGDGSATLEPNEGGVVLRIYVERLEWLARRLMTLECALLVRRPPELRAVLRELAADAWAYADCLE